MKKFAPSLIIAFILFSLISSCKKDEVTCDHCTLNTPYSKMGSSNCYETAEECELAEGGPCEVCY